MKLLFWHILPLEKYISRRAKAQNTYKNKSKWGEGKKNRTGEYWGYVNYLYFINDQIGDGTKINS